MESAGASSLPSRRHPCARSLQCPGQRMLTPTTKKADRLDAATDRLRCGQQLDARSTLAVLGHLIDLVEANQRDHALLVADVAHEARRVSEDQQTLSPKGRGDFHGQTVVADGDGGARGG